MAPRVPQMRIVPLTEGVLFSHANVLDVVAGTYVPDRFVLVRDGRIVDISGARPAWDGAAFDLNGCVLMPGLCDGHVHVTAISADFATLTRMPPSYVTAKAAPILRGMLMRGFTTVRDAGGADFGLARPSRKPCSPALGSSSAATRSRRPAATVTCAGPERTTWASASAAPGLA